MDSRAFVEGLARDLDVVLRPFEVPAPSTGGPGIAALLKVALKNELDAADLASRWVPVMRELDIKLALAQQAGDEARHYRLIEARLHALGESVQDEDLVAAGYGPLFQYLVTLTDPVACVAAGQFAQEAIAVAKNEAFIAHCDRIGDRDTARLYREWIQEDERRHHEAGRALLVTYATTPEAQARARAAVQTTLELAEELRGLAVKTLGVCHVPGC